MQKLVTVVVPVYNRSALIEETLDSIWAQTYRPIELIVIDDGSTDPSSRVIEQWIRTRRHDTSFTAKQYYQENGGAGSARNFGFRQSRGDFIQFLDSDDTLHADRIQTVIEVFETTGCEFIQTGFQGFCTDCGEVFERWYGNTGKDALDLALEGRLRANTLRSVFARSLLDRVGPWAEDMSCWEDCEFVYRSVAESRKNHIVERLLASARRGGDNRVSAGLASRSGRELRIRCERALFDRVKSRKEVSRSSLRSFSDRLYGLALRTEAAGWTDLAAECGRLASSVGAGTSGLGRRRRIIWQLGRLACRGYVFAGKLRAAAAHSSEGAHQCPSG
jgi:glycosyltransferase involved in cell wall biosynthesis